MDESGSREVVIPLHDGTQLSVGERGIQLGERALLLSSLEDARLSATQPETITLRAQGNDAIEAQPLRPGDAAVALEAIYRVRADLRPRGYATLPPPPGYPPAAYPPYGFAPPPAGYPAAPTIPGGYSPPPMYPPPMYPAPFTYAPNPNAGRGELTAVPRTFEQTLDASFRLFFKHWRRWLALGLLVALVPALLSGAAQLTIYRALGITSPRLSFTTRFGADSGQPIRLLHLPDRRHLVAEGALLVATYILIVIFRAWQTASLANGSRDALLGRIVSPAAAVRTGLSRLGATLGASILLILIIIAVLLPMFACMAVIAVSLSKLSYANGAPPTFSGSFATAATFGLLMIVLAIPGLILAVLFGVRLSLGAYIAATEDLSAGAALKKSWGLTRGYFWRSFGIYLVAGLAAGAVTGIATLLAQQINLGLDLLVVTPLLAVVTTPFTALAATVLLHDLRLRREGYAAVVGSQGGAQP